MALPGSINVPMGTDTHHREANRAAPQVSTANVIPNQGYTPDMDDALVTTEEAARQLGIRPRAIVARIAELHGARLQLSDGLRTESCPPGLRVSLSFPLAPEVQ